MTTPFEDMLSAGYQRIEEQLGQEVTIIDKDGSTVGTVTTVFNELVGAFDEYGNSVMHFREADHEWERNQQVLINGDTWTAIDIRNAKDGTVEIRFIIADITP